MTKEEILIKHYGIQNLKPKQEEIINSILLHQDTIGILPTGYGKSITYQLPALLFEGMTLVITPLIALMKDQVSSLKRKQINAAYINSLQTKEEQNEVYDKIRQHKIKILYVSAERLFTKKFLEIIFKIKISLLVCDEAHTLLWGEDFRMALGHIPDFIETLGYRPIHLAVTATATEKTIEKIKKYLKLENPKLITLECDRPNIYYRIVHSHNKQKDIIKYIYKYINALGIIYCLTIKNCLLLYKYLESFPLKIGIYHGSLSAKEKEKSQEDFIKGNINIMICTNAFGMGIDIPNIRYIILYDMPICIEDFVQQSGRASRDGAFAETIVLFQPTDIKVTSYFIECGANKEKEEKSLNQIKKDKYKKLDSMIEFCLTKKCLHQFIMNYFKQYHNGNCKMCSNCRRIKVFS